MIRELSANDLQSLVRLYGDLHESDSDAASGETLLSVWETIEADLGIRYLGLFAGKNLVSACDIGLIPYLIRGGRPYALNENVVPDRLCRGCGYGRKVLEAAWRFAWDRNCYKVMLMTSRHDEGTSDFCESAGFKRHEKEAFIARPRTS